mmetsp:Transcript_21247/g.67267  ORF Transcript_21247/g.67267 Transcript_21247/m.67267 type:complete len:111 (+) Transcript_21247:105-437(+)
MSLFCPTCANLLLVEHGGIGDLRFFCQTCPYIYNIDRKMSKNVLLENKKVDDVLGGEDAWKNVDKTEASCSACGASEAYFMQIQIRSADEPASIFYKCINVSCGYRWREG